MTKAGFVGAPASACRSAWLALRTCGRRASRFDAVMHWCSPAFLGAFPRLSVPGSTPPGASARPAPSEPVRTVARPAARVKPRLREWNHHPGVRSGCTHHACLVVALCPRPRRLVRAGIGGRRARKHRWPAESSHRQPNVGDLVERPGATRRAGGPGPRDLRRDLAGLPELKISWPVLWFCG
jgi:hypothetical protein